MDSRLPTALRTFPSCGSATEDVLPGYTVPAAYNAGWFICPRAEWSRRPLAKVAGAPIYRFDTVDVKGGSESWGTPWNQVATTLRAS